MRPLSLLALACLPLLGACQWLAPQPPAPAVRPVAWEQRAADCAGERCSLVNVETLRIPEEPRLEALIEQRLLAMTASDDGSTPPASLRAYADALLASAREGRETWLQAKLVDRHGDLLVIELSSYLYSGGAHGMPGRGFINYSLRRQRALQLDDLLLPGREDAFWDAAREARRDWLRAQQLDGDRDFQASWPFVPTANLALLHDRLQLKYDVYALAPYAMGHPTLEIPYPRLQGVLRPEFLPGR